MFREICVRKYLQTAFIIELFCCGKYLKRSLCSLYKYIKKRVMLPCVFLCFHPRSSVLLRLERPLAHPVTKETVWLSISRSWNFPDVLKAPCWLYMLSWRDTWFYLYEVFRISKKHSDTLVLYCLYNRIHVVHIYSRSVSLYANTHSSWKMRLQDWSMETIISSTERKCVG